jgi:acetate kinase
MGFAPLDGLVMATRSGSIDPGLLLWLEEHEHLRPHEVADSLEHAPALRKSVGARLGYLGVAVDEQLNATARLADRADPDAEISAAGAAVRTLSVRSREDLQIAAGVEQALGVPAPAARA